MNSLLRIIIICVAALSLTTGCAVMDSGVHDIPVNGAPVHMVLYEGNTTVGIRNTSSGKIHIIGVVTRGQDAPYIDNTQPGSFDQIIYPGETANVVSGGSGDVGGMYYLTIKSWSFE